MSDVFVRHQDGVNLENSNQTRKISLKFTARKHVYAYVKRLKFFGVPASKIRLPSS